MNNQKENMSGVLVWDIETIPQHELSEIQEKQLAKKIKVKHPMAFVSTDPNYSYEDVDKFKNLLMSTNPFFGQVLLINSYEHSSRYPDGFAKSFIPEVHLSNLGIPEQIEEKKMLVDWWEYIRNFNGTFVGFNSLNFDAYFTIIRSMQHVIEPTNTDFLNLRKYSFWPHYDIMQQLANWGYENKPTLELACDLFKISSPKSGEIKAENVYSSFKQGKINEISTYCGEDVRAAYELYKIVRKYKN